MEILQKDLYEIENQIKQNVHTENEINKIGNMLKPLYDIGKELENEKALKVNMELRKNIKDILNLKLKEIETQIKPIPLNKGAWVNLSTFYLSNNGYSINITLRLNFMISKGNGYDKNIYVEKTFYIADIKENLVKPIEFIKYDLLDFETELLKVKNAFIKKVEFEKALNKISFYKNKTYIENKYISEGDY